jgi:hypothetical protein
MGALAFWQICPTCGRCYDHNFLRFLPIFCEKMAFFSKNNVSIEFLHNLALFGVKNANFLPVFFGEQNEKKS